MYMPIIYTNDNNAFIWKINNQKHLGIKGTEITKKILFVLVGMLPSMKLEHLHVNPVKGT